MSSVEQMRINTSLFAPMILDGPSLWQYSGWQQCANHVDRRIEITAREGQQFSGANWGAIDLTYTPPKTADRAGETVFMGHTNAVTQTGGTYVRTVEAFGVQVWKSSRVINGQNTLQIFTNDDYYDEYTSMHNTEERDAIAFGLKSELSAANRATLAGQAGGFDWWVDMPYYWTKTLDRNLNLFAQSLEHTITITLNPYTACYETDGTIAVGAVGLTNLKLRILYSHYSAKERDDYLTDVCTGMGLVWKIRDIQRTVIKIANNPSAPTRYDLNSINGDVQTLVLMCRLTSDVSGTATSQPYSNFQKLPKVRIVGNGNEEFYPWTEGDYILYHLHRKAGYPAPAGKIIYRLNFERQPALGPNSYSGSLYFGNISSPALEIDWTGAAPGASEIQIYVKAIVVNFLQHQNGEISRAVPTF